MALPPRLRRRLDRERRIKKAIRRADWGWAYSDHSREFLRAYLGRYAETPKPCSCWLCSRSRRYYGPTRAERLAALVQAEQEAEYYADAANADPLDPPHYSACLCHDCLEIHRYFTDWEALYCPEPLSATGPTASP